MYETMDDFIDYVYSFYNTKDGIYPMKGVTKKKIAQAAWIYLSMCSYPTFPHMNWGDGDSLDREHVRDILLEKFNLTWSN